MSGAQITITVGVPPGSRTCEGEDFRCSQLRAVGAPPWTRCGAFRDKKMELNEEGRCVRLGCCLEAEARDLPSSTQSRESWTYADGEKNALVHAWYGRANEDRELARRSYGHLGREYRITTTVRVDSAGEPAPAGPNLRSCADCGVDALTAILDLRDPSSGLDRLGALVRDGWLYSLTEGKLLCPGCASRRGSA